MILHSNQIRPVEVFFTHLRNPWIRKIFGILAGTAVLSVLSAGPAWAEPPVLDLPADCRIGETCWLVNMVDRDPGPGRTDFRCGPFSYDKHKGTDLALADRTQMVRGVAVLASAPGRVLRVRDGVGESRTQADIDALAGRDCGNGVVIDHGGGWTTQYCHMKAGSLRVSRGGAVERGDILGEIGMSGRTEFPHVHIAVRQGETVIDPFTGGTDVGRCDPDATPRGLWSTRARDLLRYPGPQPFNLGFAPGRPDIDAARAGTARPAILPADAPALVFWADSYTFRAGDKIVLELIMPDGGTLTRHTETVDRPLARGFYFAGRRRTQAAWPAGVYVGRISVTRGAETVTRETTIEID